MGHTDTCFITKRTLATKLNSFDHGNENEDRLPAEHTDECRRQGPDQLAHPQRVWNVSLARDLLTRTWTRMDGLVTLWIWL